MIINCNRKFEQNICDYHLSCYRATLLVLIIFFFSGHTISGFYIHSSYLQTCPTVFDFEYLRTNSGTASSRQSHESCFALSICSLFCNISSFALNTWWQLLLSLRYLWVKSLRSPWCYGYSDFKVLKYGFQLLKIPWKAVFILPTKSCCHASSYS